VQTYLRLLSRVHSLITGGASQESACATVAATSRHLMGGCSKGSLRRKYDAYFAEVGGGWRALARNLRAEPDAAAVYRLRQKDGRGKPSLDRGGPSSLIKAQWADGQPDPRLRPRGRAGDRGSSIIPPAPGARPCPRCGRSGFSRRAGASAISTAKPRPRAARVLFPARLGGGEEATSPLSRRDPSGLRPFEVDR